MPQIMLLEDGRAETSVGVSVSLNWSAFILLSLPYMETLDSEQVWLYTDIWFFLSVKKINKREDENT